MHSLKRRLAASFLALSIALAIALLPATPASAHDQWTCPHGTSCLFKDFNGGGAKFIIAFSVYGDGKCHNLNSSWADYASSVVADYGSGYNLFLYQNANCSDFWGANRFVSPSATNFDWFLSYLNNDVESFVISKL